MKFIGMFCVIVASTILAAWMVYLGWAWFLVPLGVPAIGVAHSYGIAVFVGTLTRNTNTKEYEDLDTSGKLFVGIAINLVAILLMYLSTLLM